MNYKHFLDLNDYSMNQVNEIIDLGLSIYTNPEKYMDTQKGKILATAFFEPSTRTQLSFAAAMLRLGGQVIGFDNPDVLSVAKGETLTDTIKVVSQYADILTMRHPLDGSARAAASVSDIPVINAGDGEHLHPTQTLIDLVTIKKFKGEIENLTIGLCGDLKYGRTVHSLIKILVEFSNIRFVLISTNELKLPEAFTEVLKNSGCKYTEVESLSEALPDLDVLYMTRIQKERFPSEFEYNQQKDRYLLNFEKLTLAKPNLAILHPLPRVDEIDTAVDADPRALYFEQVKLGMYARMALITYILNNKSEGIDVFTSQETEKICTNKNCITAHEKSLNQHFITDGIVKYCEYCEHR